MLPTDYMSSKSLRVRIKGVFSYVPAYHKHSVTAEGYSEL